MVINNVIPAYKLEVIGLESQDATGTSDMIIGKPGNEVELYYNGSQKIRNYKYWSHSNRKYNK